MEIKLCGVGGQGMGVAGRLLGEAAMLAGLRAAQTTAYGVESRGGLSTSDVIISSDPIAFPEVRRPDALLLMSDKGLKANLRGAHEKTLIFYDPGAVNGVIDSEGKKLPFQFLEIALKELGDREAAMLIALGALVEATKVVPWASLAAAMTKAFSGKNQEVNLKALERGRGLIGA